MSCIIGILDYGTAGNIYSISQAIEQVGGQVIKVSKPEEINTVDKLVLPGVGSFSNAMHQLHEANLVNGLKEAISDKELPTLGICLGMQLFAQIGYERGETEGLNLLDAEVRQIKCKGVLPHMGFNTLAVQKNSALFSGISEHAKFYFMHSYEMNNYTDVSALSRYCEHTFVSSIEKNNLFGVQFHPEKSREAGLQVFNNFVHNI
jgi:imidazole glycerol phosphate synthase glutamine amidotransferase subunit